MIKTFEILITICVGRVWIVTCNVYYFLFKKQAFNGLLNSIDIQIKLNVKDFN